MERNAGTGGSSGAGGSSMKALDEIMLFEKQIHTLSTQLGRKEEEYITALEVRDKEQVARLEDEIKEITDKRDSFQHVSNKRRAEHAARASGGAGLVTVVYTSDFTGAMSLEDISRITSRSVTQNSLLGVTGVLMFSLASCKFLQVLEGHVETVGTLFKKIEADTRHTHIVIVRRQNIDVRRFPDWHMHPMNLAEHDKAEQPLQTVMSLVTQQNHIANLCLHANMRNILVKGGNPLFVQPKKMKAIVMMVGIIAFNTFACMDAPACSVSNLMATFSEVVTRCIEETVGTVIKTESEVIQAQWGCSSLKDAKACMTAIVESIAKLRAISTYSVDPLEAKPELPLAQYLYPTVSLCMGNVVLVRHSTSCEVKIDVVGPAVLECKEMLKEGLTRRMQAVVSGGLTNTLAFSKQYHMQELSPKCFAITSPEPPPADLEKRINHMVHEQKVGLQDPQLEETPAPDSELFLEETAEMVEEVHKTPSELVMPAHPYPSLPLHAPLPCGPFSDRVVLTDHDLKTQFESLDVADLGTVPTETFLKFYNKFDNMGVTSNCKVEYALRDKKAVSYDEFCLFMLQLAQE